LKRHFKKRKKSSFLTSEKTRKIRILEHWLPTSQQQVGSFLVYGEVTRKRV